jgi:hypothetical protein
MSTKSTSPYTTYANETFAYGVSLPSPISYQYRFGRNDNWATTTVNGILGYWVRARLTTVSNITQIPSIIQIKLHTNRTEINADGFTEFFGRARPVRDDVFSLNNLYATGIPSESAPSSNRLVSADTGTITISGTVPNCRWRTGRLTTVSGTFIPHKLMDTSLFLTFKLNFSNGTVAGPGNIAFKVDYAFVGNNNQIGIPNGTISPRIVRTTGYIAYPVSTVAYGLFEISVNLNITGLRNNEDGTEEFIWFKLSRDDNNILDTYSGDIYLNTFHAQSGIWCVGGYYTS